MLGKSPYPDPGEADLVPVGVPGFWTSVLADVPSIYLAGGLKA